MPRKVAARFRKYVQNLIPASFRKSTPSPFPDTLHLDRERDQQKNERTTPPDNEKIDLCCIWAIEFFTPSHMDALLSGLQRFGWRRGGLNTLREIEEWLDKFGKLSPGVRGGWFNLGLVSASSSPFIGPSGTNYRTRNQVHPEALPPHHVTEITGSLMSITSSLSCVIMGFVLDDEYSTKLDTALNTNRQTFYNVTPHYRDILDPERQKKDDIKQIRLEIKATVTNWFSSNLPGLFSSGLLEGEMPTCELVTLRDAEPFAIPKHLNSCFLNSYFLRLLGLESSYDAWSSTDVPGLRLSLHNEVTTSPEYHSILSIRECNLSDESLEESMGWSGRKARTFYIDNFLNHGQLHTWALLPMLEGYGNHLRSIRDSATLKPSSRPNSISILDKLASNVSFSIDIDAVTSELQRFAEPESWKCLGLPAFEPVMSQWYVEGHTLADSLGSAIHDSASLIQKTDRSLREHGTQYGAHVGAMENVRIQEKISRFTCVLVALTIILTIVTVLLMALTIILGLDTLEKWFPISRFFEWLQSDWVMP